MQSPGTSATLPPPPTQPPTARFQEKREALLDAAARHFNAQGVKGATLGEIAAQVGLVTTSLTYYYRKKEDLATACFLRAIAAHDALARQALGEMPTGTVAARVSRFLQLHALLLADMATGAQPALIGFADIRALPEPQAASVFAAYTDMFRSVRQLLVGPEAALLGRDDLNARAHLLLSAAHWLRAWVQRHAVDDYPRVAQRQAQLLLQGVAAAGSSWPDAAALAPLALDTVAAAALQPATPGTADDHHTADAFLRAATILVNEQGYRGASVDRISARLHVTKGSFYHHNDNKHDLISACFDRSFAVVGHTLRAAGQGPGTAWQRACAAVAALVRFQLGPLGPLLRTTATSALPDEPGRAHVRRQLQQLSGLIASLLVDGLEDGSLRPHDPAIAAQLLSSAINAAAELQRWVPGISPANATALYTRPALLGLLSPA
ncbi:MAG: TetR/AcrR family transcriptional regulator [Aquabacterium sp.]|nr:TetR/AcrR family transcriptional regulator [Aquabacterium sp.]